MICSQCNKEFIPSRQRRKYCSIKCSKESRKKQTSKYYKEYHQKSEVKEAKKENRKKWLKTEKGKKYLEDMNSPEKKRVYNQTYSSTQKGKEANRRGVKKALKTNPTYKMANAVRRRLGEYLNLKGLTKTNKTFTIVGCTPAELKIHLEKQFKPGMTWWNHTPKGWHIDHIIPLASAETLEETEKLAHYTNLQPMWAKDNIKKSNKII
jgi:hypothetical protein